MNSLSFYLIVVGVFLFGFVSKDLALSFKLDKKFVDSYLFSFTVAFVALVGFFFYPFFVQWRITSPVTSGFYGSVFFWSAVALFAGSILRFVFTKIKQ